MAARTTDSTNKPGSRAETRAAATRPLTGIGFHKLKFYLQPAPHIRPYFQQLSGAVAILSQVSKQASYTIALQAGRASSSYARGQEVCIAPVLLATEGGRQKSSRGTGGSGKDEQPLPPCLFHCQYE